MNVLNRIEIETLLHTHREILKQNIPSLQGDDGINVTTKIVYDAQGNPSISTEVHFWED